MELIYSLFFITAVTFAVFGISSFAVNYPKYKLYKPTYDAIKSGKYVFTDKNETFSTFRQPSDKDNWWSDDEILFFHRGFNNDSIKLLGKLNYIHAGIINWFDPYTTYWFYKLHSLARTKMTTPSIEEVETVKDKSKL
jgi:hypothetical protein